MHSHSTSLHASKKLSASKRLSVSELEQKLAAAQEKLEEAMRDEFVDPQSGLARNTAGQSQAKLEVITVVYIVCLIRLLLVGELDICSRCTGHKAHQWQGKYLIAWNLA